MLDLIDSDSEGKRARIGFSASFLRYILFTGWNCKEIYFINFLIGNPKNPNFSRSKIQNTQNHTQKVLQMSTPQHKMLNNNSCIKRANNCCNRTKNAFIKFQSENSFKKFSFKFSRNCFIRYLLILSRFIRIFYCSISVDRKIIDFDEAFVEFKSEFWVWISIF
jgi:hypothetical protein